jgi:hypothetical protein
MTPHSISQPKQRQENAHVRNIHAEGNNINQVSVFEPEKSQAPARLVNSIFFPHSSSTSTSKISGAKQFEESAQVSIGKYDALPARGNDCKVAGSPVALHDFRISELNNDILLRSFQEGSSMQKKCPGVSTPATNAITSRDRPYWFTLPCIYGYKRQAW